VGFYFNSSEQTVAFAEGWTGGEWRIQPLASPSGAAQTEVVGVSCTQPSACAAVGVSRQASGATAPLGELWNGSEWELSPAPSPTGSQGGELQDISCVATYACEATGSYVSSSGLQVTLAEGLGAPGARTSSASNVSRTAATLVGFVSPNQWATTYHFEYGTTTSYGTSVPVPNAALASETAGEAVQRSVTNLRPNTTYHFRLVASNLIGTTNGEDRTFSTHP
jgi:hypothetical protein